MQRQSIDEFARGTEHLEDRAHLAGRLARGDRLRIKFGVDPTAPDIHLGHTVPMRRLRAWQEAGHLAVIIIGDWTARIGDPTGRNETRPQLDPAEVEDNAQTYLAQLFAVIDRDRTEVRRQTEWFDTASLADVLRLTGTRTVQQILQRSDFSERMLGEHPISVHELLYPLLQGYDSVAVHSDVELGGTDQLFNLLTARDVQRAYGQEPQDIVTVPLLEGTNGTRKMSKSYGNYVGVADAPSEQFGRAMSIPDDLIVRWFRLVTDVSPAEVDEIERTLHHGDVNPRDVKRRLAETIVRQFHGGAAARAAAEEFARVVSGGGIPADAPEAPLAAPQWQALELVERALDAVGRQESRGQIRRLIAQGGVVLIDAHGAERRIAAHDEQVDVTEGDTLRVGKRTFVRCAPSAGA